MTETCTCEYWEEFTADEFECSEWLCNSTGSIQVVKATMTDEEMAKVAQANMYPMVIFMCSFIVLTLAVTSIRYFTIYFHKRFSVL